VLSADVVSVGIGSGVPVLPGAFTPTEIVAAGHLGARLVKLFPTAVLGPEYLTALRQPLPDVRIVPTGGVSLANARDWLDAGAAALGLGSPLTGDSLETGDLQLLRSAARTWCREVARQ
jgi:2-dehydro-3-deoxyphosphogluconate aldolase/(4S)-4-hydroxy-2-oxoglutarate aldolase